MPSAILALFALAAVTSAQKFLLPGTEYSDINGACPIKGEVSLPVDMIIWPNIGLAHDPPGAEVARANIAQYFDNKGPASTLANFTSIATGLGLWRIVMTNTQACGVASLAGVDAVMVDGEDPDYGIDAPLGPLDPNVEFPDYVFQGDPGGGITIYLVESGVNNADFRGRMEPQIIRTPQAEPGSGDDSIDGHATCVAVKAAGTKYGVEKLANMVVAKKSSSISDIGAIFGLVHDDIIARGLQKKAVVTFSWGSLPAAGDIIGRQWSLAALALGKIMRDLDVPVVTSAGNDAKRSRIIDRYPKSFQEDKFPIINVGATDPDGSRRSDSQDGPLLTVSAPGADVTCLNRNGQVKTVSGTSFAAPQVAGLVAYLMGLEVVPFDTSDGKLALAAMTYLQTTASYPRSTANDAPRVAWNLIDEAQNPPSA
nr:hypothetical protein B0A51_02218 [Rachicladosporium sp. CCFEE 5018]